ncbi:MAG: SDR family NAD(P)-dependent oxidoreductase [Alphaproteobacteria bacterium]|nr:SDR family NAD(P)-dependent oxidoreductase [Alphaproteobacteria bacterium]
MNALNEQVAIVTGASRGIGRAVVQAYARQGARVVLVATREAPLRSVCNDLGLSTEQTLCVAADVSKASDCQAVVSQAMQRWGQVDVLVNNAGIYHAAPFLEHTPQDFQRLLDVNLFGVMHFMQACLPHMQLRRSGSIINIASTAGKWGSRNQSAYNTSKHAVVGLTRCVALEASTHQVTVNAICPGFVQTDMIDELKAQAAQAAGASVDEFVKAMMTRVPLGRLMQPTEIAEMAVFLGSSAARGITGQSLHIDGGMVFS